MKASLSRLQLEMPPHQVEMDVRLPSIKLRHKLPAVRIDVRYALEDLGIRRNQTIARLYATLGREAALRATARMAREGDMLRDVHLGTSVAEVAAARGRRQPKQLNVDVAPKTRVEVETIPGSVELELEAGEVRVQVPPGRVTVRLADGGQGSLPGTRLDVLA